MPSISFGGIVSGLDTGSIVSQLVALRRIPINRMEQQQKDLDRSLAALNDLKSALSKLADAAKDLKTDDDFEGRKVTSNDTDILSATAGSGSPTGIFKVTVDALAATHREVTQEFTSANDEVGTGDFSFTLDGTTTTLTLEAGANSLADLKFAINEADAGVTASIVNNGSGFQLLLSAEDSGLANRFTVDATGLGGGTAPAFTTSSLGNDAQLTLDDSIVVSSSSNTFGDVFDGLSIDVDALGTTEISIDGDSAAISTKLQAFADAYNGVVTLMNEQTKDGGSLEGSSLPRTVRSRLTSTMTTAVETGGNFRIAADIGLSLDRDGVMSLDTSKLSDAIDGDLASVMELFTRADEGDLGIAAAIDQTVHAINASSNGLIRLRRDSIGDQKDRLEDRIARDERSLEIYEQTLNRKFTAMERIISQLNAQSGLFR